MIVSCAQMLDAEKAAFARGVEASQLMSQAGQGIFEVICQFQRQPGTAVLYLGKGNNAGDALVVGRLLVECGWRVVARLVGEPSDFKELPAKYWQDLEGRAERLTDPKSLLQLRGPLVLLDGLLGIGTLAKPLSQPYADAVAEMNALRRERHAWTLAIDLPSGLNPLTGEPGDPCVLADITVAIAYAKNCLLADTATAFVGRLAIVPLTELDRVEGDAGARVLTAAELLPTLPRRSFDFHKGQAGRVGLAAGSSGLVGAAMMTAAGALRAGGGLITLYVPADIHAVAAAKAAPEVMVKAVSDYREVLQDRHDVVAIGPGLGRSKSAQILEVIRHTDVPLVLDADALNIISEGGIHVLSGLKGRVLLTPHPGEMARLADSLSGADGLSRAATAEKMAGAFPGTVWLYKGARTVIAEAGKPLSYNSTGHPGMATGGMGDVLTGICAALIGQGIPAYDAACLGAWLSGRAAESALAHRESTESLTPGAALEHLGRAFTDLRRLAY